MQLVAKNSGITIGLAITIATFLFFGGMTLGSINTSLDSHQSLPAHIGQEKIFVPRAEADIQFNLIRKELEANRRLMEKILIEVKK